MLKLPFKTTPSGFEKVVVGDPAIGELEIPKMMDLSPNERIFIKESLAEYPDLRSSAVKMARAIATKSGQKLIDVYNALTSGNTEELGEYLEEFIEFQDLMEQVTSQRRLVVTTAILRYRLLPEWTIDNTGDANLIHPKLVEAIADFAQKEESGWVESATEPISEEDLGKSQPEALKIAEMVRTGVTFSGE